jgi:type VI protein secretion system component Hcp
MGHQYQRKTDAASQKRRPKIAPGDEWQNASSHVHAGQSPATILNLQRTIGNQAVQRLIQRDTALPADAKDKDKTREIPPFVARIVGERSKFQSKSTIPGHEGKVEVLSFSIEQNDHKVIISFTKYADELSPIFLAAATQGESLKEAEFAMIRRNDRDEIETMQTFAFKDGHVSSMSINSGSGGDGKASEFITLEFPVKAKEK